MPKLTNSAEPLGDKVVLVAILIFFAWIGLDAINAYISQPVPQQAALSSTR